jgi:hypothetical protein
MPRVNLYDQLTELIRSLRRYIGTIDDGSSLKRWFSIELKMLRPGPRATVTMEDLSARMRAVRQLEYMVLGHLEGEAERFNPTESLYTTMSRVPASLWETVRQTNFSIEPPLLVVSDVAQHGGRHAEGRSQSQRHHPRHHRTERQFLQE